MKNVRVLAAFAAFMIGSFFSPAQAGEGAALPPEKALTEAAASPQSEEDLDAEYGKTLLKAGSAAPEIALMDIKGRPFSLKALRGKYVVLDFWASWCPDCRREIPDVLRLYKKYAPKGVVFVGVSFDDKEESWRKAVKEYGLDYSHVSELCRMKDSTIAKAYGIKWIPSMYLIGPDGKVKAATVVLTKVEAELEKIR